MHLLNAYVELFFLILRRGELKGSEKGGSFFFSSFFDFFDFFVFVILFQYFCSFSVAKLLSLCCSVAPN